MIEATGFSAQELEVRKVAGESFYQKKEARVKKSAQTQTVQDMFEYMAAAYPPVGGLTWVETRHSETPREAEEPGTSGEHGPEPRRRQDERTVRFERRQGGRRRSKSTGRNLRGRQHSGSRGRALRPGGKMATAIPPPPATTGATPELQTIRKRVATAVPSSTEEI